MADDQRPQYPFSGLPDSPENYREVTWALTEQGQGTELTVTEVNLPAEEAKRVSEQGWRTALDTLKQLRSRSSPEVSLASPASSSWRR
jgi:hypothetical protein